MVSTDDDGDHDMVPLHHMQPQEEHDQSAELEHQSQQSEDLTQLSEDSFDGLLTPAANEAAQTLLMEGTTDAVCDPATMLSGRTMHNFGGWVGQSSGMASQPHYSTEMPIAQQARPPPPPSLVSSAVWPPASGGGSAQALPVPGSDTQHLNPLAARPNIAAYSLPGTQPQVWAYRTPDPADYAVMVGQGPGSYHVRLSIAHERVQAAQAELESTFHTLYGVMARAAVASQRYHDAIAAVRNIDVQMAMHAAGI
jgi:hypothetical protein